MARRFEDFYQVKKDDNLGDPEYWNRRLEDLDLRLAARELDGDRIADAVDQLISVGLGRIDDTFTPVIEEALARLQSVGAQFSSTSDTEATINTDPKTFVLAPETWASYVVTDYVAIRPADHVDRGIIAQVTHYDRATGLIDVTPVLVIGSGTYSDWLVRPSPAPDIEHATRTDNPHETTAAQVGAYLTTQADTLFAPKVDPILSGTPAAPTAAPGTNTTQIATTAFVRAAVSALVASAPGALDTLNELAAALGNDAAFSTTVADALSKRVRFDAAQTLAATDRDRFRANVLGSPLRALAGGNLFPNPAFDHSQQYGTTGTVLSSNAPAYMADEMLGLYTAGAGVLIGDRVAASSFPAALPGFEYGARLIATTALSSLSNGTGRAQHYFGIEYSVAFKLQWGTARARRLGYTFQYYSTNAGTVLLRWQNGAADRLYYTEHVVSAGWNLISGIVAGDTSGNWAASTGGFGLSLAIICAGAESVKQSSFRSWGTTFKLQSTNLTNLLNTTNAQTIVTGLMLSPDIDFSLFDQTVLRDALPDMMMHPSDALTRCMRYFWRSTREHDGWGWGVSGNNIIGHTFIPGDPQRLGASASCTQFGSPGNSLIQYDGTNASTTSWTFSLNGPNSIGINAAGGTITSATGKAANIRLGWTADHGVDISSRMI